MHQVTKHLGQLCSTTRCLSGGCNGGPTGKWVEVHHERHMYLVICIYIYMVYWYYVFNNLYIHIYIHVRMWDYSHIMIFIYIHIIFEICVFSISPLTKSTTQPCSCATNPKVSGWLPPPPNPGQKHKGLPWSESQWSEVLGCRKVG